MSNAFNVGDKVMTTKGLGCVVYRRLAPPDFNRVVVYSVKLDGVSHSGEIFSADELSKP